MINMIVYLKKQHNPAELIEHLLREELIATATIDENNISYSMNNGVVEQEVNYVITMQTKALLFNEIVKIVEMKFGQDTPINSVPIVSTNRMFEETIRSKTKKI
jgi:uncharacterized protein involved in tolerance to divalent cations